jgi:hypothetical protein
MFTSASKGGSDIAFTNSLSLQIKNKIYWTKKQTKNV